MGEAAITWFEDAPYDFLSNFHPATVRLDGVEYPTVEHAYQAAKALDLLEREHVRSAPTPAVAKERGRQVTVRPNWDDLKVAVMRNLLAQKFSDPVLRERLAATAPLELIEGNTWGDRFWGVYDGEGANWLGRLLTEIRDAPNRPWTGSAHKADWTEPAVRTERSFRSGRVLALQRSLCLSLQNGMPRSRHEPSSLGTSIGAVVGP